MGTINMSRRHSNASSGIIKFHYERYLQPYKTSYPDSPNPDEAKQQRIAILKAAIDKDAIRADDDTLTQHAIALHNRVITRLDFASSGINSERLDRQLRYLHYAIEYTTHKSTTTASDIYGIILSLNIMVRFYAFFFVTTQDAAYIPEALELALDRAQEFLISARMTVALKSELQGSYAGSDNEHISVAALLTALNTKETIFGRKNIAIKCTALRQLLQNIFAINSPQKASGSVDPSLLTGEGEDDEEQASLRTARPRAARALRQRPLSGGDMDISPDVKDTTYQPSDGKRKRVRGRRKRKQDDLDNNAESIDTDTVVVVSTTAVEQNSGETKKARRRGLTVKEQHTAKFSVGASASLWKKMEAQKCLGVEERMTLYLTQDRPADIEDGVDEPSDGIAQITWPKP
jgi:hypothetical protein